MREIKKSFWDFVVISGSTLLSIPLMIVSESIQARYLGAANYGKVALIYSAISLVFLFSLNWLSSSIIRFGKEEYINFGHLRKTTTSYLFSSVVLFLPSIILLYFLQKPLFEFLEIKHPYAFWIIVGGIAIQICKTFVLEMLKALRLIKIQGFLLRLGIKIFILAGVGMLAVGWFHLNVNNIIAVMLISDLLIAIIGFLFIKKRYIFPLVFDKKQLKIILTFCLPFFFGGWVNYILNYVDTYTIKYYMELNDVGIYQAAYKIFNTLKSFVGMGITTIMVPIIIVMKTEGQLEKIKSYLKRIVPLVTFAAFIVISLIITFSDVIIILIYGKEFADSITPFKILIAPLVLVVVSSLMMGIYIAYDMTRLLAILGVLGGLVNLVGDIILVQYFGIKGAALATAFTYTLFTTIWFFIIYNKFSIKRNISLLFCSIIFVILVVNLLLIPYILRILFTLLLLIITTLFARQYNLFNKKDIAFIQGISMPNAIKRGLEKFILLMSK